MSKRRRWKAIFKGQMDDFDPRESLRYWKTQSTEQKFREVQRLIDTALEIKGRKDWDGSELLRTTAVLKRG